MIRQQQQQQSFNLRARIIQMILAAAVLLILSSCSTYPNKFKCGDAKGLGCTMLRDVDKQIDSGQIEEVYKNKNKKCKGDICTSGTTNESLDLKKQDIADSYQDERSENLEDDNLDNNLRF